MIDTDGVAEKRSVKKRRKYPKTIIPSPAISVECKAKFFSVTLKDGRVLSVPLEWYPRLELATPEQRKNYEINILDIHWPDVDEDISIQALLDGKRSLESKQSIHKSLKHPICELE